MGRRLILKREARRSPALATKSEDQWFYAVLAFLSKRYPPLKGRLSTCYSPVRRSKSEDSALDLHVLSVPLTFVLSQDQTLQFKSFISVGE